MANKEKKSVPLEYVVIYESLTGIFELILGSGIILFGKRIFTLYLRLQSLGYLEHSHNILVLFVRRSLPFIIHYHIAIAIFIILLGSIKIVSAVGLWRDKLWANYLLISTLVILLPFDVIEIIRNPSAIKIVYFVVNILIIIYLFRQEPSYLNRNKRH